MKKIYFLMSALVLTVAMNAQQLAHFVKPELKQQEAPSAVYTQPLDEVGYENGQVPFKAPLAEEKDTTMESQYWIDGQMYMSYKPGYISGNAFLITPYKDTTLYYSVWGKGKWVYDSEDEEGKLTTVTVEDTAVLSYPSNSYGWSYYNPTLTANPRQLKTTDGSVVYNTTFTEYMYGYGAETFWPGEIAPTNMMNGYWQPEQMTNCEMLTGFRTPTGNAEQDEQASINRWMVSSGQAGTKWCFGTGMEIDVWGNGTLDTLCNIIPIPEGASMWVDTIFVHCYNLEATSIEQVFPATTNLKLTIYPITIKEDPETGKLTQYFRHDSIMAQATAVQKNCVEDGGGYSIQFVFKAKNPLGVVAVKPAALGQYCYAELTGFNESGCNFGIYCDYYETPTGGRTLWLKDNKFHSFADMNIDMAFNGYYTDMHFMDETWIEELGAEGGAVSMGYIGIDEEVHSVDTLEFLCNISTDFEDDADLYDEEGVALYESENTFVTDYEVISGPHTYEEGGSVYISLTCQVSIEVEANEGYDREFTVYLIAYGAKLPITITQLGKLGPDPLSSLTNVKHINDNVRYNIFGQKVNKAYKGIVILNGQKLLQ